MGLLPMDVDILPASDDRIFKLLLTSPEGKPALIDLISAVIRRPVTDVAVRNNEIPVGDTEEKAERLDVNCTVDDGSQVDLEMQASRIEELSGEHKNLKGKSIFYLCDLHSSQQSKGKRRYDELVKTYQVTFCSYTVFPELQGYTNSFSMRHDANNLLLSDAIHVVFVELSKLSNILKKSVNDMTDLEKWAVFFRFADVLAYRETVNKVIESKEALQMAGNLLMSVSKDERERAIFRSRRMFDSDQESNMATAEERGKRAGLRQGKSEGLRQGKSEIARNLLKINLPLEQIIQATGLTREELAELQL